MANYCIARVLVDSGSSVNMIFEEEFSQMQLEECKLEAVKIALFGFVGYTVYPRGQIVFSLILRMGNSRKTRMALFAVVEAPSSYNIILGRPALNGFMTIASTYHQKLKYLVGKGVGDQGRSAFLSKVLC